MAVIRRNRLTVDLKTLLVIQSIVAKYEKESITMATPPHSRHTAKTTRTGAGETTATKSSAVDSPSSQEGGPPGNQGEADKRPYDARNYLSMMIAKFEEDSVLPSQPSSTCHVHDQEHYSGQGDSAGLRRTRAVDRTNKDVCTYHPSQLERRIHRRRDSPIPQDTLTTVITDPQVLQKGEIQCFSPIIIFDVESLYATVITQSPIFHLLNTGMSTTRAQHSRRRKAVRPRLQPAHRAPIPLESASQAIRSHQERTSTAGSV